MVSFHTARKDEAGCGWEADSGSASRRTDRVTITGRPHTHSYTISTKKKTRAMPPAAGVGKVFLPALFLCLLAKNQPSVRKQQPHIALGSRTCGRYAGWFLFYFFFFFTLSPAITTVSPIVHYLLMEIYSVCFTFPRTPGLSGSILFFSP